MPITALDSTGNSLLQDAEGNHCSSFPTVLLQVMWKAAQLSRTEQYPERGVEHSSYSATQLRLLLHTTQSFDPLAWATDLQPRSPTPDLAHRTHVAHAHREAVCIYLARLILSRYVDTQLALSVAAWVSEAIAHMACIRQSDALFTATTWPAFIAGAETSSPQEQAWIAQRFSELWEIEPWGTISGALDVLRGIWSDKRQSAAFVGQLGNTFTFNNDWIGKLRQTGVDWLII